MQGVARPIPSLGLAAMRLGSFTLKQVSHHLGMHRDRLAKAAEPSPAQVNLPPLLALWSYARPAMHPVVLRRLGCYAPSMGMGAQPLLPHT